MEYELVDRSQHVPAERDKQHQRGVFIPDEERESDEEKQVPLQMEG